METKHTKKEWYAGVRGNTVYSILEHDIKITVIDEDSDNELKFSKHIAESLNVSNETGKTPRQLADENQELLSALVVVKDLFQSHQEYLASKGQNVSTIMAEKLNKLVDTVVKKASK